MKSKDHQVKRPVHFAQQSNELLNTVDVPMIAITGSDGNIYGIKVDEIKKYFEEHEKWKNTMKLWRETLLEIECSKEQYKKLEEELKQSCIPTFRINSYNLTEDSLIKRIDKSIAIAVTEEQINWKIKAKREELAKSMIGEVYIYKHNSLEEKSLDIDKLKKESLSDLDKCIEEIQKEFKEATKQILWADEKQVLAVRLEAQMHRTYLEKVRQLLQASEDYSSVFYRMAMGGRRLLPYKKRNEYPSKREASAIVCKKISKEIERLEKEIEVHELFYDKSKIIEQAIVENFNTKFSRLVREVKPYQVMDI